MCGNQRFMKHRPEQSPIEVGTLSAYKYDTSLSNFQKSLHTLSIYGIDIEKTKEKLTSRMRQHGDIIIFLDGQGVHALTTKVRNDLDIYLKKSAFTYKLFKLSKIAGNRNIKDIDLRLTFALDHTNKTIIFLDIYQKKNEHADCSEESIITSLKEYEQTLSDTKKVIAHKNTAESSTKEIKNETHALILYLTDENSRLEETYRNVAKERDALEAMIADLKIKESKKIQELSKQYTTNINFQKDNTNNVVRKLSVVEKQLRVLQNTHSKLLQHIHATQLELPFDDVESNFPRQLEIDFTSRASTTSKTPEDLFSKLKKPLSIW